MDILLTNDDGIYAQGLNSIYLELKKFANVTIVAPDSERSSVGHGITLSSPLRLKKVHKDGSFLGYGLSGTPADCVKFALEILMKKKPDLIVSGINLGPNEGCSVHYSGTVAAAREGAMLGIPSIAVSLNTFHNPFFSFASKFSAKFIKSFNKEMLPKGTFLNINIPNTSKSHIKGIRTTKQCQRPIHVKIKKKRDPHLNEYYWLTGKMPQKQKDLSIDTNALNSNYIAITPIKCDTTDYDFLSQINAETYKI